MLRLWRTINDWPFRRRAPLKALVFTLAVVLALFPRFWLIPQWITRISDMNAMLDPQHPRLASFESAARERLAAPAPTASAPVAPQSVAAVVERVVYERIPYDWDWNVWGNMDHLPTVDEVLSRGVDDCDGRAVVAASLLRRMGYKAWLVNDIVHTWVQTEQFETMSPRASAKTFVATDAGTKVSTAPAALLAAAENLAHGLGYGVTVFPYWRQLLLICAFCAVALQPYSRMWRRCIGLALPLLSLLGLQFAAGAFGGGEKVPVAIVMAALTATAAGALLLIVRIRRSAPTGDVPLRQ